MDADRHDESAQERLLRAIDEHVASERNAIDLYRRLRSELPDPVLSTIMRLIVEEEEHHHRTLFSMAMALRSGWSESRAIVPHLDAGALAPSVLADTISELEAAEVEEREGAREFRELSRTCAPAGVIGLLLELMALDSDKHERMLRFVLNQIRAGTQHADSPPAAPAEERAP